MVSRPPAMVAIPPMVMDGYRQRMREHFAIPVALDVTRCIACRAPQTVSAGGQREHEKTGVCEACWDLLVAPDERTRRTAVNRCTRLTGGEACAYVANWIAVNRVAPGGTLTCAEPLARHIIGVGTNQVRWLPGERP